MRGIRYLIAVILYYIEWIGDFVLGKRGRNVYRKGSNWAPVSGERAPRSLRRVYGKVPSDFPPGYYVRNGPNLQFPNDGPYHLFDGDGMLHSVAIEKEDETSATASANYCRRYVKTSRYQTEKYYGRKMYVRIGDMVGLWGLVKLMLLKLKNKLNLINLSEGTANTAVEWHHNRLLALQEQDHPYWVRFLQSKRGDMRTVGRYSFGGDLKHPMTAHPKICPDTQELVFFGYQLHSSPYLSYSVADKNGKLLRTVDLGLDRPLMMHDFALTKNYAIFLELPLEFRRERIIFGFPFIFNPKGRSRVGIVPRALKSASEVIWIDLPEPFWCFHTANAFEANGEVFLYACRMDDFNLDFALDNTKSTGEFDAYLWEWRIDIVDKTIEQRPVSQIVAEFPRVHPGYIGRKNNYIYLATVKKTADEYSTSSVLNGSDVTTVSDNTLKFDGVMKVDLSTGLSKRLRYGLGWTGGEMVFVPRVGATAEDDGYLVGFIHNREEEEDEFVIYDAKVMDDNPVARFHVPERVPYGFHGTFVHAADVKEQCR